MSDKRQRRAREIQVAMGWPYTKALREADRRWYAYQEELPKAQAQWHDGYPPSEVMAVAKVMDLDAVDLWDHVESEHGWEPHDSGYEDAVWAAASCTESHE